MPFTPAHAAAAWPLRRPGLAPSAVVVGTMAPDFEYFVRLSAGGGFGHTIAGALLLSLPLGLLVLWMFHALVKAPLTELLPRGICRRLPANLEFRFGGTARFAVVTASVLAGIVTHIVWDSFTHRHTWLYLHWAFLRRTIRLPWGRSIPLYALLQHSSTVLGLTVVVIWVARWYRRTEPGSGQGCGVLSSPRKWLVVTVISVLAVAGASVRVAWAMRPSARFQSIEELVGDAVVTAMALAWWQVVVYGLVITIRRRWKRA